MGRVLYCNIVMHSVHIAIVCALTGMWSEYGSIDRIRGVQAGWIGYGERRGFQILYWACGAYSLAILSLIRRILDVSARWPLPLSSRHRPDLACFLGVAAARNGNSLGSDSIGLEILNPLSAAAFSPCLPNPNPPNRAPGLTNSGTSGTSGLSLSVRPCLLEVA